MQGYARVCKGMQGYTRVCKGMQGYARVFSPSINYAIYAVATVNVYHIKYAKNLDNGQIRGEEEEEEEEEDDLDEDPGFIRNIFVKIKSIKYSDYYPPSSDSDTD